MNAQMVIVLVNRTNYSKITQRNTNRTDFATLLAAHY